MTSSKLLVAAAAAAVVGLATFAYAQTTPAYPAASAAVPAPSPAQTVDPTAPAAAIPTSPRAPDGAPAAKTGTGTAAMPSDGTVTRSPMDSASPMPSERAARADRN